MSRSQWSLAAVGILVLATTAPAQAASSPSGHWEGVIKAPDREVRIEVDLATGANGALAGTFGNIGEGLRGFPLSAVSADGKTIRFAINAASAGGRFDGLLADDGASISGKFATPTPQGEMMLPFSLQRTGEAHIESAAKSAAIGAAFEGTWSGTLDAGGKRVRLALTLHNAPDGTSSGTILTAQDGVAIPITSITQTGADIKLVVKITGGAYEAKLNAAGTELVGTWTQGSYALPLTFQRAETKK